MIFGFIFVPLRSSFVNSPSEVLLEYCFGTGSFVAALGQGFALGNIIAGISVDQAGHFIGTTWDWLELEVNFSRIDFEFRAMS